MSDLRKAIEVVINRHGAENGSDTPDFILAEYLDNCLKAFDAATLRRLMWYAEPPDTSNNEGLEAGDREVYLSVADHAKAEAWDERVKRTQLEEDLHRVKHWRLFFAAMATGLAASRVIEMFFT